MATPTLHTSRCLLRGFTDEDLDAVFRGLSHPQVIAHYGVRYATREATREQMAWFAHIEAEGTGRWWAICPRGQPDQLMGAVGLNDLVVAHRRAEIGYWLLPEHWGQGLAAECAVAMIAHAFGAMGLYRLAAEVDLPNHASRRLLQRLGFREEGVRRAFEWKDGAPLDLVVYSRLADDPGP